MEMVFRWVEMGSTPHNTDLRLELDGGACMLIYGAHLWFMIRGLWWDISNWVAAYFLIPPIVMVINGRMVTCVKNVSHAEMRRLRSDLVFESKCQYGRTFIIYLNSNGAFDNHSHVGQLECNQTDKIIIFTNAAISKWWQVEMSWDTEMCSVKGMPLPTGKWQTPK